MMAILSTLGEFFHMVLEICCFFYVDSVRYTSRIMTFHSDILAAFGKGENF